MTVTHLAQVKALTGIDPVARVILGELADEADSNGRCAPPLKAIALRLDVSVDTVRRRLSVLERAGFLRREQQRAANGSPAPALVVLTLGAGIEAPTLPTTAQQPAPPPPSKLRPPLLAGCDHPPSRLRPPLLADCEEGRAREIYNSTPARAEPLPTNGEVLDTNSNFSFDAFWGVYPKKPTAAPGLARKKFERLDLATRKRAIAGAEAFAQDCARGKRRGGDAARWLEAEGWAPWLTRDGRPRKAAPGRVFVRQHSEAWQAWEAHHRRTGALRPGQPMFAFHSTSHDAYGRMEVTLFPPEASSAGPDPPAEGA